MLGAVPVSLKPDTHVQVTSPDGKTSYKGIAMHSDAKWCRVLVTHPGTTGYAVGEYKACPLKWVTVL